MEELKTFLTTRLLGYWKLFDATNQFHLYVDRQVGYVDRGQLRVLSSRLGESCSSDEMYWTRSGDDLIENKATGWRGC